jgi:hypothetical protein
MPASALGELQIESSGGRPVSPIGMAAFFTLHAGIFMGVHFFFLWELFAGEWSHRINGVRAFIDQLVIGTGLWVPLLVLFVARGAFMLFDAVKPALWRKRRLVEGQPARAQALGPGENIIFGLYIRIFVMQATVILGAWFALLAGTAGALAFLILVKTAVDLSFQVFADRFRSAWMKAKAEATAKTRP